MSRQYDYCSEKTLNHLQPLRGLPERYKQRALDIALAEKLTQTYCIGPVDSILR